MTDKKEIRYIKRTGELSRACGLMLGMLESLIFHSDIPTMTRMNAKKILSEVRELLNKK